MALEDKTLILDFKTFFILQWSGIRPQGIDLLVANDGKLGNLVVSLFSLSLIHI